MFIFNEFMYYLLPETIQYYLILFSYIILSSNLILNNYYQKVSCSHTYIHIYINNNNNNNIVIKKNN